MKRFEGQRVIITGGSSGIGLAIARQLASEGASVLITYHTRRDFAEQAVESIKISGGKAFSHSLDLTDSEMLASQLEAMITKLGGLHILINNAGEWMKKVPIVDCELAFWNRMIGINLTSAYILSQGAAKFFLRERRGVIINISSMVARTGGSGGTVPYCVAKAGVNTLTRGLARELAAEGIRINAVAPGLIDTPMLNINFGDKIKKGLEDGIPLRRIARPEEIAQAVCFLASPEASYITGEIMEVNGGALMD